MTAKITEKEMAGVPHHLFSLVALGETRFTVREYLVEFGKALRDIQARGKTPIVVGGTNYYIEATLRSFMKHEEVLQLQPLLPDLRARIQTSLQRCDFAEMIALLAEVDPEAAKLTVKNDTRRLSNALKRLLNHQAVVDSEMYMEEEDHRAGFESIDTSQLVSDFVLINLDCEDMVFLEDRLQKRIRSMFEKEGGAEEILRVCYEVISDKGVFDESKSAIQNASAILLNNVTVGVLQSIGYKEFFDYVFEMLEFVRHQKLEELASRSIRDQIALLFETAISIVGGVVEERVSHAFKEISNFQNIHRVIDQCISKLTASTLLLTKKQRRYLKNRLLPRIAHCDIKTYMINSVDGFFAQLPVIKEHLQKFMDSDRIHNSLESEQNVSMQGVKKTHHRCEVCNIDLVGESMWRQHSKSKSHKYKYGKSKRLMSENNNIGQTKTKAKKTKNKPVACIFDDVDEETSKLAEEQNPVETIEIEEHPSAVHK